MRFNTLSIFSFVALASYTTALPVRDFVDVSSFIDFAKNKLSELCDGDENSDTYISAVSEIEAFETASTSQSAFTSLSPMNLATVVSAPSSNFASASTLSHSNTRSEATATTTTSELETETTSASTTESTGTIATSTTSSSSSAEITGRGTYYSVGADNCGTSSSDSDYVCAIAQSLYKTSVDGSDVSSYCGKYITANYNGKSVVVKVVDSCASCADTDLDFSPSAFQQLADLDVGEMTITWSWN